MTVKLRDFETGADRPTLPSCVQAWPARTSIRHESAGVDLLANWIPDRPFVPCSQAVLDLAPAKCLMSLQRKGGRVV
jgi:hypothetical protein